MKKLLKLIGVVGVGLLLFWGVLLFFGSSIARVIYQTLFYGKYNTMFIAELVLLLFSLIVLLVRHRTKICLSNWQSFWYGIKRGLPILIVTFISLVGSVVGIVGEELNIPNFLSLIILAIIIGMAEEFFFRGFIQGEICDKYGTTRRGVIVSIIVSGIIFGVAHLTNIFSQDLITTIMQVIQSSAIGILFGSVFYISKNIWSVVFLHSFYDFAIMLGEVNSYKDCVSNSNLATGVLIFMLIGSLVYAFIYLVGAYLNLQKRNIDKNISELEQQQDQEKATIAKKAIVVVVVILFLITPLIPADGVEDAQICYNYPPINIKGDITFSLNEEFIIGNLTLRIANNKLVIKNNPNGEEELIEMPEDIYDLYVYQDSNYHIILNANEIIYYGVVSRYNLEITENTFKKYDVPEISDIGSIKVNEEIYPIFKSYISDYFIIKDNTVMVISK